MGSKKDWDKVKDNISGYELKLGTYFSRQLLVDAKHALFAKLNTSENPYIVSTMDINMVPQIIFVKGDKIIEKIVGVIIKKIYLR